VTVCARCCKRPAEDDVLCLCHACRELLEASPAGTSAEQRAAMLTLLEAGRRPRATFRRPGERSDR
jgi:hypothetical protein